jgi:hypothetical protein
MSTATGTVESIAPSPEGLPGSPQPRALTGAVAFLEANAIWILLALMAVDGALLLYMGRSFSFFGDDWSFATVVEHSARRAQVTPAVAVGRLS